MLPSVAQNQELIRLAEHTAAIEKYYKTDEHERLRSVSRAFLECIDYALVEGFIAKDNVELPQNITTILSNVYTYFGDPL